MWYKFNTPIYILNFNRFMYLQSLIESLEIHGYTNIIIVDNGSTLPDLKKYYNSLKYKIFYCDGINGPYRGWELNYIDTTNYYVVTDSDIQLNNNCPDNFLFYFYELLNKYQQVVKIGTALDISDLPDKCPTKQKVIEWEIKHWGHKLEEHVYEAPIDTTFALYRPGASGWGKGIRIGGIYTAKHLPWYEDPNNLTYEQEYYHKVCSRNYSHWCVK